MHLRFFIASLLLLPILAFADVAVRCHASVTSPLPGSTAVAPDVVIRGSTACQVQAPLFVDDAGAAVPAKFATQDTGGGATFTLTPLAPLAAHRTYSVTFPDHLPCDGPLGQTQFTTGGTPGIRALTFQGSAGAVVGLDVYLTEPVLHPVDLANGTTWVTATVDGYALVPPVNSGLPSNDTLEFYYKLLPQWPTLAQTYHVQLHKGLQFASGSVLAADVEVTAVPNDVPYGWVVTGSQSLCAADNMTSSMPACTAQRVGRGRGVLALLMVAGVVMLRRRMGGRDSWT